MMLSRGAGYQGTLALAMSSHELDAMRAWVEETDRIAMAHFRVDVPYERKTDGTPVTEADRAIERMLRERIEAAFPGDAILGEEEGASGDADRVWIIDPIDGTKNFARGIPVFATLLALEVAGEPVAALVSAPALGARWWAVAGIGAFRGDEPIRVSAAATVEDSDVCTGGLDWAEGAGKQDRIVALSTLARRQRGFGDFWGYMLVAQGSVEAMVEFAPLAVWDVAACKCIVRAAGGRFTDVAGNDAVREGAVVATNGLVHDEVLTLLA